MIKMYSTKDCPKCQILKTKMNEKKIPYEVCEDVEEMISLNILSVPHLLVNDKLINFTSAIQWVNQI